MRNFLKYLIWNPYPKSTVRAPPVLKGRTFPVVLQYILLEFCLCATTVLPTASYWKHRPPVCASGPSVDRMNLWKYGYNDLNENAQPRRVGETMRPQRSGRSDA